MVLSLWLLGLLSLLSYFCHPLTPPTHTGKHTYSVHSVTHTHTQNTRFNWSIGLLHAFVFHQEKKTFQERGNVQKFHSTYINTHQRPRSSIKPTSVQVGSKIQLPSLGGAKIFWHFQVRQSGTIWKKKLNLDFCTLLWNKIHRNHPRYALTENAHYNFWTEKFGCLSTVHSKTRAHKNTLQFAENSGHLFLDTQQNSHPHTKAQPYFDSGACFPWVKQKKVGWSIRKPQIHKDTSTLIPRLIWKCSHTCIIRNVFRPA